MNREAESAVSCGRAVATDLGPIGVWWNGSWDADEASLADVASELESLGYGALWSSGLFEPGLAPHFASLLGATDRLKVASGIVSIWATEPDELSLAVAELEERYPGRFLLGLGTSHADLVQGYERPLARMVAFLDALDMSPTPPRRRVLAALRPRMLDLAARRSAGAHPYLVPVEHTAVARSTMGPDPVLAPEVAVVLERDPSRARTLAREFVARRIGRPNYAENLRALGYDDDDLAGGGSDRLVDALVSWGDSAAIAERVHEHLDAGADHVCVQVVADQRSFPLAAYRELAPALLG